MSSPIVILGMQRSGTSALSGALWRLGLWFGKEEMLYAADDNNRQGYFEHRMATAINLKILDEFGMHVTSFDRVPENWAERPQALELLRLLWSFVTEELATRDRWAIKQPLTSLVLPLYNRVFAELGLEPHYVVCLRNPLEAMESEATLEFGDSYRVMQSLGTMAIGSWLRYTLGSICDAAPYRVTVAPYEELFREPRRLLEEIVSAHPDWRPSEEQWGYAMSSIRSDLRHHRRRLEELDIFPPIVRQTYEAALRFARTGASAELEQLQEFYAELGAWEQILGAPPPMAGKLSLTWQQDGARKGAEAAYPVEGRWTSVRVDVGAPSDTELTGLVYGLPARVWIRRCVWACGSGEEEAVLRPGAASELSDVDGFQRLDAAFEAAQVRLSTPNTAGPYALELELLVETGPPVHMATASRLAGKLERCAAEVTELLRRQ